MERWRRARIQERDLPILKKRPGWSLGGVLRPRRFESDPAKLQPSLEQVAYMELTKVL